MDRLNPKNGDFDLSISDMPEDEEGEEQFEDAEENGENEENDQFEDEEFGSDQG
jgi:hypothetical protein